MVPLNLFQCLTDELVREVEDQDGSVFNRFLDIRCRGEIRRQLDTGEVLDVLVGFVDHGCELLWLVAVFRAVRGVFGNRDFFFEDPHPDIVLELGALRGVFGQDFGDC